MSAAEEPSPSPAPAAAAAAQSATQLPIHTYHCICTQLLFASTTPLSSLPRRGGNDSSTASDSQQHDRAYILPLPPPPRSKDADEEDEDGDTAMANKGASDEAQAGGQHYALLLGAFVDRGARPRVVQRDDGFEKRYLHRCQRCRVVVGYQLDWAQYPSKAEAEAGGEEGGDAEAAGVAGKSGRRTDVVYLLPGGLLSTEEMVAGKDVAKTVGFA